MSRSSFIKSKIQDLSNAQRKINAWKASGLRIVFTNGCFDILHKGHVSYLAQAAELGDRLVLALNTDASVKRQNKGVDRPINPEDARQLVVASLGFVDLVVLFDSETPYDLIALLKPDVLVKGADYDPNETNPNNKKYIVGSDLVKKFGGEVKTIDLEAGFSTSAIVDRLKKKD